MTPLLLLALAAPVQAASIARGPHSSVELVSRESAAAPGEPILLGLRFKLDPEWHIYWRNAGDSGSAPTVEWRLPEGASAGPLQWPLPRRIMLPPLANYGYEREVLLPVEARAPRSLRPGERLRLEAEVDWLVCREECLPAGGRVSLDLPAARRPRADPRRAGLFERALAALPASLPEWGLTARAAAGAVELEVVPPAGRSVPPGLYFFPADGSLVRHAAPQSARASGGSARLTIPLEEQAALPARLEGALSAEEGWDPEGLRKGLLVSVPVSSGGAALAAAGLALLGGLLLNLMPCVFPVLSIKVLGLLRAGGAGALRAHSALYSAGVVASFWILAGALLLLRSGGERLGWGFQLQSQPFVALLCLLFFVLGLHLLGALEPGAWLTRLGGVGAGGGPGGAFASGILAVLAATPCTAPFMGTALGYALARPAGEAWLVFTALGAGMAAPTVLISLRPGLLAFLPRPGPWMETLKQALAFPLFATAGWLFWVFDRQAGPDAAARLLGALLALSLAAWAWGRFRSTAGRLLGTGLAAAAAAAALAGAGAFAGGEPRGGIPWESYSAERLQSLRGEGRPVFVDFTAAWCLTCQVNERVALSSPEVEEAFRARGVAALKADWTSRDPEITRALAALGRAGVPVYAYYPPGGGPPRLLPVLLTPGIVLEGLAGAPGDGLQSR